MYEAQQIKATLTMAEVARFYGFEINRQSLMVCPFHNDNKPSLRVYDGQRGWHCFSCGTGGDIIDFVRKLYSLDFKQALAKLNDDFRLGMDLDTKPSRQAAYNRSLQIRQEKERKAKLQAIEDWLDKAEDSIAAYIRLMWGLQDKYKPIDGEISYLYQYAIQQFNFYEDLHQRIFIEGNFDTKMQFYKEQRGEVEKIIGFIHTGRQIGIDG